MTAKPGLTEQELESLTRRAADAHREHTLRADAERRLDRVERENARWQTRIELVERRMRIARMVLAGELDDLTKEIGL